MTGTLSLSLVLVLSVVAQRNPALAFSIGALVIPSGSFHPSLRVASPIGQLTPFMVLSLLSGTIFLLSKPKLAASGIRTVPALIGTATTIIGLVSATASWVPTSLYWVLNGGVVLTMISIMLASQPEGRNRRATERAVTICGVIVAATVVIEQ